MKLLGALLALVLVAWPAASLGDCPQPVRELRNHAMALARQAEDTDLKSPPVKANGIEFSEFIHFCERRPSAVLCAGGAGRDLTLFEVQMADAKVRVHFEYMDDIFLFGVADWWSTDAACGDCEDYALAVSEELRRQGEAGADMGLIMWLPTEYAAHATLVVRTFDAGYVEIGVGSHETPAPIDWMRGRRLGVIWMDGRRQVSPPPMSKAKHVDLIQFKTGELVLVDRTEQP